MQNVLLRRGQWYLAFRGISQIDANQLLHPEIHISSVSKKKKKASVVENKFDSRPIKLRFTWISWSSSPPSPLPKITEVLKTYCESYSSNNPIALASFVVAQHPTLSDEYIISHLSSGRYVPIFIFKKHCKYLERICRLRSEEATRKKYIL